MTAKYYDGLAGIEHKREKTCTICVHANPGDRAITHVECMCEKSDHYCHIFVAWHPACNEYQQGIMPQMEKIPSERPAPAPKKRRRGKPRKNEKSTIQNTQDGKSNDNTI